MKAFSSFLLLLITTSIYGQYQIVWQKNYGSVNQEYISDFIKTSDNGYIIIGGFESDVWVVKTSSEGSIEWENTYGGSSLDVGMSIIEQEDGYVICANSSSKDGDLITNVGRIDVWVFKISNTGELLWSVSNGGSDFDEPVQIIESADGGFAVLANSQSNDLSDNNGSIDLLLIKLSSTGTLEWSKNFGGSKQDFARSLIQDADGNYIIGFFTTSDDKDIPILHSASDYGLMYISNQGELLWVKTYGGGGGFNTIYKLISTSDGGYIMVGRHGGLDCWVIKIDNLGNLIWQNSLGGNKSDSAENIIETTDGYIIVGRTESDEGDISTEDQLGSMLIYKLNKNGQTEWISTYGGNNFDRAVNLVQVDNGYVILAESWSTDDSFSNNQGEADAILFKIQLHPTSISSPDTSPSLTLYPNPTADKITIKVSPSELGSNYEILNRAGQIFSEGTIKNLSTDISLTDFPSSNYIFTIINPNQKLSVPFVKN